MLCSVDGAWNVIGCDVDLQEIVAELFLVCKISESN